MTTRLKIPDAAYAIDTTPLSIRKWFEKGQVVLPEVRAAKGEVAEFGDFDLLFCALMVKLINFGARVRTASEIAQYIFEKVGAEPTDNDYLAKWHDKELWITNIQPGSWKINIWPLEGDISSTTTLVIDTEKLFSEVLARANERRAGKVA